MVLGEICRILLVVVLSVNCVLSVRQNVTTVGFLQASIKTPKGFLNRTFPISTTEPLLRIVYKCYNGEEVNFTCTKTNGTQMNLLHWNIFSGRVLSFAPFDRNPDRLHMTLKLNSTFNNTVIDCAVYNYKKKDLGIRLTLIVQNKTDEVANFIDVAARIVRADTNEGFQKTVTVVAAVCSVVALCVMSVLAVIVFYYWKKSKMTAIFKQPELVLKNIEDVESTIPVQYENVTRESTTTLYEVPYATSPPSTCDEAQTPTCSTLSEGSEADKPYIHYDTPYEWRIFRFGRPVIRIPDRLRRESQQARSPQNPR